MKIRFLVVDDEVSCRNLLKDFLESCNYAVDTADGVNAALELLEKCSYDIIISDKNMPAENGTGQPDGGMHLLRHATRNYPETQIIMVSGHATLETGVTAMKLGAFDFLAKPFCLDTLQNIIERILEYRSFINPKRTIGTYRSLHNEILGLLEKTEIRNDIKHSLLRSVDHNIDKFFKAHKRLEHIIIEQRDSLANIAMYAALINEKQAAPLSPEASDWLRSISELSDRRL